MTFNKLNKILKRRGERERDVQIDEILIDHDKIIIIARPKNI